MSAYSIRAANQNDLEALHSLMHQLHTYHHLAAPEHIKTADEIDREKSIALYLDSPECLVYVAEQGKEIVGFITGHFCELVAAVSKPVQMGSVDELFVCPQHRQQGIAEALFEKLQESFEDYGVKQVFVEVWEFNQSAVNFYHKMEFNHHIHWLRKSID